MVRPRADRVGWGDILEIAMVEWHIGADQIVREWSYEMLFLYFGKMVKRKEKQQKAVDEARAKQR